MAAAVQSAPGIPATTIPKYVQEKESSYECTVLPSWDYDRLFVAHAFCSGMGGSGNPRFVPI